MKSTSEHSLFEIIGKIYEYMAELMGVAIFCVPVVIFLFTGNGAPEFTYYELLLNSWIIAMVLYAIFFALGTWLVIVLWNASKLYGLKPLVRHYRFLIGNLVTSVFLATYLSIHFLTTVSEIYAFLIRYELEGVLVFPPGYVMYAIPMYPPAIASGVIGFPLAVHELRMLGGLFETENPFNERHEGFRRSRIALLLGFAVSLLSIYVFIIRANMAFNPGFNQYLDIWALLAGCILGFLGLVAGIQGMVRLGNEFKSLATRYLPLESASETMDRPNTLFKRGSESKVESRADLDGKVINLEETGLINERSVHPLSEKGKKSLITAMFLLLIASTMTFLGAGLNSFPGSETIDPAGLWIAFAACSILYIAMAYYWYNDLHAGAIDMKVMVSYYLVMIGLLALGFLLVRCNLSS